ncbi:MAG: hypothetical protein ACLGJD_05465 [Gammaproteobacteria bacterium]
MSEEEHALLLIRGAIAGLPEDDRAKVEAAAAELRALIEVHGEHGFMAVALVGAEMAAKQ